MVWLGDEVVHFGVAVSHFEYVVQLRLLAISPRFESGISTNDTGTLNLLKITQGLRSENIGIYHEQNHARFKV